MAAKARRRRVAPSAQRTVHADAIAVRVPSGHDAEMTSKTKEISAVRGYHAHVYFDAESIGRARVLCETAAAKFGVEMGRVHERPVGPHPMWSCQLACSAESFASLLPWLALNRDGLIIFAHPETGDHLADHRDHAIWLGTGLPLDLSIFSR